MKIILLLIYLLTLTGCYNYRELDDLAISSAIGIDMNDNLFHTSIQIINTQKVGEDSNKETISKFYTFSQDGNTIQESLRKMVTETPRRLYANHIMLLVISEEVARNNIEDVINFLAREPEIRKQFYVLISKDSSAEEVLSIVTSLESLNAFNISNTINSTSKYLGNIEMITFEDLLKTYLNSNLEISIPVIEISGNEKQGEKISNIKNPDIKTKIKINKMSVFKNNKLIGFLDEKNSINLSYIKNKIDNSVITLKCDDSKYMTIESYETKTKTFVKENKILITIKGKLNIAEVECNLNLENIDEINKLENIIEEYTKNEIKNTYKYIIDNYNSDMFEYKDYLYKTNNDYYKKIKNTDYLKNLIIDVNIEFSITEEGNIIKVKQNE